MYEWVAHNWFCSFDLYISWNHVFLQILSIEVEWSPLSCVIVYISKWNTHFTLSVHTFRTRFHKAIQSQFCINLTSSWCQIGPGFLCGTGPWHYKGSLLRLRSWLKNFRMLKKWQLIKHFNAYILLLQLLTGSIDFPTVSKRYHIDIMCVD